MVDLGAPDFPVVHANAAYSELLGFELAGLVGKSLFAHDRGEEDDTIQLRTLLTARKAGDVIVTTTCFGGDMLTNLAVVNPIEPSDDLNLALIFNFALRSAREGLRDLPDFLGAQASQEIQRIRKETTFHLRTSGIMQARASMAVLRLNLSRTR